jgi:hypothetical protein
MDASKQFCYTADINVVFVHTTEIQKLFLLVFCQISYQKMSP